MHAYPRAHPALPTVSRTPRRGSGDTLSIGVFTFFTRFVGRINRAESIGLSVILVAGYWLVQHGSITVGQTTAAALLFHRLFGPISMLLFTADEAQDAGASLARLVGLASIPQPTAATTAGAEPRDGPPISPTSNSATTASIRCCTVSPSGCSPSSG